MVVKLCTLAIANSCLRHLFSNLLEKKIPGRQKCSSHFRPSCWPLIGPARHLDCASPYGPKFGNWHSENPRACSVFTGWRCLRSCKFCSIFGSVPPELWGGKIKQHPESSLIYFMWIFHYISVFYSPISFPILHCRYVRTCQCHWFSEFISASIVSFSQYMMVSYRMVSLCSLGWQETLCSAFDLPHHALSSFFSYIFWRWLAGTVSEVAYVIVCSMT